jgi:hypothetical protein
VKQKVVMMLVDVRRRTCNGAGEYVETREKSVLQKCIIYELLGAFCWKKDKRNA